MIKKFFSKHKNVDIKHHVDEVDVERMEQSFNLLRSTTSAVSEAASEAARVLEQRLRDTEFRFYSTIDAIEDFVVVKDGQGLWKTVNKSGQQLFNWIHGEYFEKTDLELARQYPIYTECLQQCTESDERAWRSGKSYRSQECIPYGSLGYRCFDVIKTPIFDKNGKRKELIVVGRDITEEIEKQRRMKAAFIALNSASDNIVILDYRGNIFFCNDVFLFTFNIKSYESVVGKHICDILNIENYNDMWELISHNNNFDGVYSADGGLYGLDHDLHITPMMNGQPYPIYYICTLKKKGK